MPSRPVVSLSLDPALPAGNRLKRFKVTSQEELLAAQEAHARNEALRQQAAAEKAAAAAAKAGSLQRRRSKQRVQQVLGDDDDLPALHDLVHDLEELSAGSSARPSQPASSARPRQPAVVSHEERQLRFELGMRQHNANMLQWGVLHAAERAAALRQDLVQRTATVQERIHEAVEMVTQTGLHFGCLCCVTAAEVAPGPVKVVGWRPVILQTFFGQGAIDIATFK